MDENRHNENLELAIVVARNGCPRPRAKMVNLVNQSFTFVVVNNAWGSTGKHQSRRVVWEQNKNECNAATQQRGNAATQDG